MPGDERKTIYYPISEDVARRAKEMNSFSDYKPGGPMYHEKIDRGHIRPKIGGEYEREFFQ